MRAVENIAIPFSISNILKELFCMLLYKMRKVYQLQQKDYAHLLPFSEYCMDNMSSSSSFTRQIGFLVTKSFASQDLRTLRNVVLVAQKTQETIKNLIQSAKK